MSKTLIETVRILEQRAEYLEKEAAHLRQELAQVAQKLATESPPESPVVARYTIEGETYEITEVDVEAVRANLVKPWPDETIQELAVAKKMAKRHRHLSRKEKFERLFRTIEASRAAAIADGTAIEHEWEAAIDD